MATELTPNEGKKGVTVIDGVSYQRLPIKTHLITKDDDIVEVAYQYGAPVMTDKDDVLFISEKCVACSQGRAIPLKDIHPTKLATWLSNYVTKTPHGIGLGMPETMQCALDEVGAPRILFSAAVSVIGKKIFKKKGWFYTVAGYKARSIDGPCHNTIPPLQPVRRSGPREPRQGRQGVRREAGLSRHHR